MIPKIKKFTVLSIEEKKLFLEAYMILGVMRTAILTVSLKRLTRSFDQKANKEELPSLDEREIEVATAVGKAISRAASGTPWESACLVQSLSAQKMLQRRGIPGVFYLGVAKDEGSREKMKAHAWSQCGNIIITGDAGHEVYTVLSVFEWR